MTYLDRDPTVKVLKESGGDLINASACFTNYSWCILIDMDVLSSQSWQRASDRILCSAFCTSIIVLRISKPSREGIPGILNSLRVSVHVCYFNCHRLIST